MKNPDRTLCSQHRSRYEIAVKAGKISILAVLVYYLVAGPLWDVTASQEEMEWPAFHGLSRTNKSAETGLLKEWPEGGPELLWKVSGLGEGYSSVTIAGGHLYTAGMIEKQTHVYAFDLNGTQIWKKPNGSSWEATRSHATSYVGSRSTPTYDKGVVYHLGETGRLAAFDYQTGKETWSLELREMFDAEIPEYGYAESIFIDGERLYCNPAGKKAFMVCLNKKDGEIIWANAEIQGTVGFSSPIIAESGGYRQIVGISSNTIYGADTQTGGLLWSVEYENQRSNNVADPIFHNGHVFASSGYGRGSILIKLVASGEKITPETVWHTDLMDNHHGGVILHDGHLYGSGHRARGLFCLDFMTGTQKWNTPGKGSLTYADNMLYFLEEKGTMTLVKALPEEYDAVGSFKVPEGGRGMHWAHPVVCGGRLYVRHADKLFAYDIGGG